MSTLKTICETCKQEFVYNSYEVNRRFCGNECAHKALLKLERMKDIVELRKKGNTLAEIAKSMGITRQRVSQVLQQAQGVQ